MQPKIPKPRPRPDRHPHPLNLLLTLTLLNLHFNPQLQSVMSLPCSHDQFLRQGAGGVGRERVYLRDVGDAGEGRDRGTRLLQGEEMVDGRLRIFVDYGQVTVGSQSEINTIKRVMNITASYFYNLLNVTRLPRLYFPKNQSLQCNILKVPPLYQTEGTIGDLGILCGNEKTTSSIYIAKSTSCVYLESNKRPIWGMIMFNNNFLRFDQEGFQQILYVGMHQMTHVLGFSAAMYEMYPKGNPLVKDQKGLYYLNSTDIQEQISKHFSCKQSKGLPLQDQDGTQIASHWQRKVLGNEYMIATNKKNSLVSNFTLALFNSTGWYTHVNFSYAQPTMWGKNKGCQFLSVDNCESEQFCTGSEFSCDHDGTGIGRCDMDLFTGTCKVPKYFVNTVCADQNYQLKNLNSNLNALQRGGSSSRCMQSDFRQQGLQKNNLNYRCYVSVCSVSGRSIYIMVGSFVLVCIRQGQVINAPVGLIGTLTCPKNFSSYCQSKKTCPYHCNKNGACINGKCQCTGQLILRSTCADVNILRSPVGQTGGLLSALKDLTSDLTLTNLIKPTNSTPVTPTTQQFELQQTRTYSLNSKCIQGSGFDKVFGECVPCSFLFRCQQCDDDGCLMCDDGRMPRLGKC